MLIKPNVSQSKITTERNLGDGIMLAIRNLNELEIIFPLRYPELSIFFLKSDIVTKVLYLDSVVYLNERNHISAIVKQ